MSNCFKGIASALLLLASVLSMIPGAAVGPPSARASALRGGAPLCYTDGTANCPPETDCSLTACVGGVCPAGTLGYNQNKAVFDQPQLAGGVGNIGKQPPGAKFFCLFESYCAGCATPPGGTSSCVTAGKTGNESESRLPQKVNLASTKCGSGP